MTRLFLAGLFFSETQRHPQSRERTLPNHHGKEHEANKECESEEETARNQTARNQTARHEETEEGDVYAQHGRIRWRYLPSLVGNGKVWHENQRRRPGRPYVRI